MIRKYEVRLTPQQRDQLQEIISSGDAPPRKLTHARILLKCDQAQEGVSDEECARIFNIGLSTVARVRKRFVEGGLEQALSAKPQPPRPEKRILSADAEQYLIKLVQSAPPEGGKWTLKSLAEQMMKRGIVSNISDETVRRTLKRLNLRTK